MLRNVIAPRESRVPPERVAYRSGLHVFIYRHGWDPPCDLSQK